LIIGATGMLQAASVDLASRSRTITSVARTQRSLAKLRSLLSNSSATYHMLALDWTKPEQFLQLLLEHLAKTEQPDLIVAWIHDDELAIRFAGGLPKADSTCDFFHVVGSATADPSLLAAAFRERLSPNSAYHQVILGYVAVAGAARWLTNKEISAGVLDAIARAEPVHIVGAIQPWPF
jgi:hypothetical protein